VQWAVDALWPSQVMPSPGDGLGVGGPGTGAAESAPAPAEEPAPKLRLMRFSSAGSRTLPLAPSCESLDTHTTATTTRSRSASHDGCAVPVPGEAPLGAGTDDEGDAMRGPAAVELRWLIGTGAFGRVYLGRAHDGRPVAVKVAHKLQLMCLEGGERSAVRERDALTAAAAGDHPFVVGARGFFQTREHVYMVLEYCGGGDLYSLLRRCGGLPEPSVRFYAAEMLSALEHLHDAGFVYRDLKPENALLSSDGHVRLADFGLSRRLEPDEKAYTTCGSSQYVAPELLDHRGYGRSVDAWSFGCLLFEMAAGRAPFHCGGNVHKRITRIKAAKVNIPTHMPPAVADLVRALLVLDVSRRAGCSAARGLSSLWDSALLTPVKGKDVKGLKLPPPHPPPVGCAEGPECFDEEFTRRGVDLPRPVFTDGGMCGGRAGLLDVAGFEWVRPTLLRAAPELEPAA